MKFRFKKLTILICVGLLFSVLCAGTVFASVETSDGKAKSMETVTIAGNPDLFPYEYYDEESGTYKGVFPDLMEIVSQKTGIDFEYVYAGETDQQLYQAKTGNAEILTAFVKDEKAMQQYGITFGTAIGTYQSEDKIVGIAYTKFILNDNDEVINQALSEIPSDEILAIMGKYIGNEPKKQTNSKPGILLAIVFAVIAAALAAILIIFLSRRKKNRKNDKIDSLTGLYNRDYFNVRFDEMVAHKYSAIYVLAFIGFDIVKVNSNYGEDAAEKQLKYAAAQLQNQVTGSNDLLVRYSGGGFVFLHVCATQKQTEEWISVIFTNLNAYMKIYEKDYKPYFRGGVYRMEPGHWDRKAAVTDAQRSYQYAVDKLLPFYIADSNESARELIKNHLKKRLSKALVSDEFKQFFQPIVDTESGKVVGAEALSRWFHPDMGVLSPARYVEMMEEEGTIFELDFLIFEKVCMTLEAWQKEGCGLWLSTNFTRITLSSREFNKKIHEIIGKYDFDHSKCIFEITEDCLENNVDVASQNVKTLTQMGFRIAIDDLGSGYTFFSDFINYDIDVVKIDRSLLLKTDSENGKLLVKGIADMCRNLGILVLAEGVETKKQLDTVHELKCDLIQGFYFYRAMPESDFEKIRTNN